MLRQKGEDKDVFNKERGLEIARARAKRTKPRRKIMVTPHIIRKRLPKFKERCLKYFKGATLSSPSRNF